MKEKIRTLQVSKTTQQLCKTQAVREDKTIKRLVEEMIEERIKNYERVTMENQRK